MDEKAPSTGRGEAHPASAGRGRARDPLGKAALYWVPVDAPAPPRSEREDDRAVPLGKQALFSGATVPASPEETFAPENPVAAHGAFEVSCARCRAVSRVGLLDLVIYSLPVHVWVPRGKYDRRLTCPACRRRVWAGVTLRRG